MSRWIPEGFTGKSYTNKPASSIQQTQPVNQENFSTDFKLDFTKASKDYWAMKVSELQEEYNKGCTVGKFGKYNSDIDDFFSRIFTLVKESITSELAKKGYTTEQLQHQFAALESSFKILTETIKTIDKDKKINSDSLCAFLHGFVNGYIETFAQNKENK